MAVLPSCSLQESLARASCRNWKSLPLNVSSQSFFQPRINAPCALGTCSTDATLHLSSTNERFRRSSTLCARAVFTESANIASSVGVPAKTPPFHVLITGSSRGIGYALAKKFLKEGDKVIICSRSGESVNKALKSLTEEFGEQSAFGIAADVRDGESVQKLIEFAKEKLQYVDIWINNAGSNAYVYKPLVEMNDKVIMEIVETNTIGVMICCREAIKMMMKQERGGHIFNMDGAGADGRPTPRFAAYGATKRSLVQLTKSLQAELKMQQIKNVIIHMLSPGMVTTDLLMSGSDTPQAKFFINVLAEPADTVAEFLVPRVREVSQNGSTKPTYIRFLTGIKAYSQILSRVLFNARKNRYLRED
ncbi:hypothetical protein KP509_07G090000 [Ceratopteris richardii]|uniref:chlorophyll(ide) b reductase n=1 Tax=Ceratopteris richardii TaxID=49495 RepID=A0A8T2UNM5_CERRI|nr:hypothetical protein KP509_07G090000 [Ceratopteris richardii]